MAKRKVPVARPAMSEFSSVAVEKEPKEEPRPVDNAVLFTSRIPLRYSGGKIEVGEEVASAVLGQGVTVNYLKDAIRTQVASATLTDGVYVIKTKQAAVLAGQEFAADSVLGTLQLPDDMDPYVFADLLWNKMISD